MATPSSPAAFGTLRPGAPYPALAHTRDHDRFLDVRAYRRGAMPTVRPGQVWADCDPRCEGRTVQILALRKDGKAVVETKTARTVPPRTPSQTTKDTVGVISVIAIRRFRPNSRGFRLVAEAPRPKKVRAKAPPPAASPATPGATPAPHAAQVETIATILASGHPVSPLDYRAAAALLGLLGYDHATQFLTAKPGPGRRLPGRDYLDSGPGMLLWAASMWAQDKGLIKQWSKRPARKR